MAKTQFGQDAVHQNAVAQHQRAEKNKWDEMLAMLQLAHKGDANTMLGFGLGRLLRDGFNTWMQNYKDRGAAKERKAYDDYEKLVKLGGYNGSFRDYYNNEWEPRYQANRRMMRDDARAQAEMGSQIASDGMPINNTTAPTFTEGGRGKGDTEMQGADNAYVPSPGASADSSVPMRGLIWEEGETYFPYDANEFDPNSHRFLKGTPFVGNAMQKYYWGTMP